MAGPSSVARLLVLLATSPFFIGCGVALAQTKPPPTAAPPAPAVSPEPQQTTATFGDWVLRCTKVSADAASPRVCEVVQTLQREGRQGVVAQIAIGRLSPKDPLKLTVLLPVNITIPGDVKIDIDEKDPAGVALAWRRCFPQGCIADAEPRDETLRKWRAHAGAGRLTVRDATNHDVSIQMSFKGLAQALDALAKS